MQQEEIVGKLEEINQDTALPMKADGEIDVAYVNKMWPGLISGITNHLIAADGQRIVANIKQLKEAGFHAFAMHRNTDAQVPAGRVRTDKGVILIY